MKNKKIISSEMLFIIAMIMNSFTLVLMVKSNFGVSTLSSVPLVLSSIFDQISLGTWTIIIQVIYILLMIIYVRKFKIGYLASFIVSIIFGLLVDFFSISTMQWPSDLFYRVIYFILGLVGMGIGAAFFVLCKLPILPFDLIVRELSEYTPKSVKQIKRSVDLTSVLFSLSMSYLVLNRIVGVGIGTIISVFLMGEIIQKVITRLNQKYIINPISKIGNYLSSIS